MADATTVQSPFQSFPAIETLRRPRQSFGSLQSIGSSGPLRDFNDSPSSQEVFIYFPSMPETIELARSAEYNIINNALTPDGIHQYQRTTPLTIPVSFKVHGFDAEFCPRGPEHLLQIAAALQSLNVTLGTRGGGGGTELVGQGGGGGSNVLAPVPCLLELISTGVAGGINSTSGGDFGIKCRGYVRDVRTNLRGPWRTTEDAYGALKNVPTSLEASFVFVHAPNYTNVPATRYAQTYAQYIRYGFFNTGQVEKASDAGINADFTVGFSDIRIGGGENAANAVF